LRVDRRFARFDTSGLRLHRARIEPRSIDIIITKSTGCRVQMLVASSLQPAARQGARVHPLDYIVGLKYDRPVTIFDDQLIDERWNVTCHGNGNLLFHRETERVFAVRFLATRSALFHASRISFMNFSVCRTVHVRMYGMLVRSAESQLVMRAICYRNVE